MPSHTPRPPGKGQGPVKGARDVSGVGSKDQGQMRRVPGKTEPHTAGLWPSGELGLPQEDCRHLKLGQGWT